MGDEGVRAKPNFAKFDFKVASFISMGIKNSGRGDEGNPELALRTQNSAQTNRGNPEQGFKTQTHMGIAAACSIFYPPHCNPIHRNPELFCSFQPCTNLGSSSMKTQLTTEVWVMVATVGAAVHRS